MTNHPNRSNYRYFLFSPRGFANELTYFRVPVDRVGEVDAYFDGYQDRYPGSRTGWTTARDARMPGVAVDWDDRQWVGLL
jgi:hypothetical protein